MNAQRTLMRKFLEDVAVLGFIIAIVLMASLLVILPGELLGLWSVPQGIVDLVMAVAVLLWILPGFVFMGDRR